MPPEGASEVAVVRKSRLQCNGADGLIRVAEQAPAVFQSHLCDVLMGRFVQVLAKSSLQSADGEIAGGSQAGYGDALGEMDLNVVNGGAEFLERYGFGFSPVKVPADAQAADNLAGAVVNGPLRRQEPFDGGCPANQFQPVGDRDAPEYLVVICTVLPGQVLGSQVEIGLAGQFLHIAEAESPIKKAIATDETAFTVLYPGMGVGEKFQYLEGRLQGLKAVIDQICQFIALTPNLYQS